MRILLVVLLSATSAFAQQSAAAGTPTPVQQTAARADTLTTQQYSGTAQGTLTIPAVQGMRIYVGFISSTAMAVAAPAASSVTTTTTGLSGTPSLVCGLTAVAGAACDKTLAPAAGIMVVPPNTAMTVVTNAAIANVNFTVAVGYYYGP